MSDCDPLSQLKSDLAEINNDIWNVLDRIIVAQRSAEAAEMQEIMGFLGGLSNTLRAENQRLNLYAREQFSRRSQESIERAAKA